MPRHRSLAKSILAIGFMTAATAWASPHGTVLAGTSLDVRWTDVQPTTVRARVIARAPQSTDTVWDRMAASLAGCDLEGVRSPVVAGRIPVRFTRLLCPDQAPLPLDAMAVDPNSMKVGVPQVVMGDTVTAVVKTAVRVP